MKSATPPRIFLDSNVWFSAFYHSQNCEKLIQTYKDEMILVVISEQVLQEVTRNIKEKIPQQLPCFQNFMLSNPPEMVSDLETIPSNIKRAISVEDQSIFTAAMRANVDYFVTGNIRDFKRNKQKKIGKIAVLTPKEVIGALGLS